MTINVHKFMCERIQCTGFVPEEHFSVQEAKELENHFFKDDDVASLYVWLGTIQIGTEDSPEEKTKLICSCISREKAELGGPHAHLPVRRR
jgi:hypothetical protein